MALINNSWLAESEQNAQAPIQVSAADNDLRYFKKHPNPKTRLQCKGRNGNCGVRTTFICSKCSAPRAEKTSSDGKRILSGYVAMCRGCYKSHPCGKRVVFQRPTRQGPRPNTILSLDMRSSGEEGSSDSDMCSADLSDDEQSDGSVSVNDSEIERLGNYSDSEIEHSESEAVQDAREAMGQVNVQRVRLVHPHMDQILIPIVMTARPVISAHAGAKGPPPPPFNLHNLSEAHHPYS